MPVKILTAKQQELHEKLQALDTLFTKKLPLKLEEIKLSMQSLQAGSTTAELELLHRLIHSLAGSAGTFGYPELGQHARDMENLLKPLIEIPTDQLPDTTKIIAELDNFLVKARLNTRVEPVSMESISPNVFYNPEERLIYFVDHDTALAQGIAHQLEYFGYEVVLLDKLDKLAVAIKARKPSAIIMDMDFPEGRLTGSAELLKITKQSGLHYPTLFISENNSFDARLAAVRAGADDYLTKPVDVVTLTDRLDKLTVRQELYSYRILIVDDDTTTSEYYAAVLRNVGMDVKLLHEPHRILGVLSEFRPELVLMDIYMPSCSGIELAKVMRQDNRYIDIPIVFLSSETNFGKQLDAIQSGADDFLTKPIKPKHLISSLSSRAQRYTSLRSLILRDSLTGLLNHSAIKDNLIREISRARREHSSLSLAMIDIDLFKRVNDSYGHPVGDQVIRALSRLLQQRLRRADLIGRYGGEEFAVIFPSTPSSVSANVLGQIREAFSKIMQHAEQGDFTVTFSAGIVDLGEYMDGDSMFHAADAVLYRAKKLGRDRIEIA